MHLLRDRFPLVPQLLVVLKQLVVVRVGPFFLLQSRVQLVKVSLSALLGTFLKTKALQLHRYRVPIQVLSVPLLSQYVLQGLVFFLYPLFPFSKTNVFRFFWAIFFHFESIDKI